MKLPREYYYIKNPTLFCPNEGEIDSLHIQDGSIAEIDAPTPKSKCINLSPHYFMLPGFKDSHVHFFQTGIREIELNCDFISQKEELFELIDKYKQDHRRISGWAYSPETESQLPSKDELDRVCDDKPVFIRRNDGHSSYINSKAAEELKPILEESEQIQQIDKELFRQGNLKGQSHVVADRYFLQSTSQEILVEAAYKVEQKCLKAGVTAIDAFVPFENWVALLEELKKQLFIDVTTFYETYDVKKCTKYDFPRIGGCLLIDGSIGSKTAAFFEPYRQENSNRGEIYPSSTKLQNFIDRAQESGLQCAMHAIGPRAIEKYLQQLVKSQNRSTSNNLRHRIEHAEFITDSQIDRVATNEYILSMQPSFEYLWGSEGELYQRRLGERYLDSNPLKKIIEKGITVAGGSDSYITPISPILGIHSAVNHPKNGISIKEAVKMFTYNGAYASLKEDEFGSFSPDTEANLTILGQNPFEMERNQIENIEVKGTFYRGKLVYCDS